MDPPTSTLAAELIRAYLATEYRVHGTPGFVLHIGVASPELLALHTRLGVGASAFLTAWNPESRILGAEANAARHAELLDEIRRRGLVALPGIGQHPRDDWPGEESLLVPGLGLDVAMALGLRFGQNAVVCAGAEGVPELVLLR